MKNMKINKKINKSSLIIIFSLILSSTMMFIGYANLTGILAVNNNSNKNGKWSVLITDIKEYKKDGKSYTNSVSNTSLTASFDCVLVEPNDEIVYKIIVSNRGEYNAKLNTITLIPNSKDTDNIYFYLTEIYEGEELKPNENKEFYMHVRYNSKNQLSTQNKSIFVALEYIQK